MDAYVRCGRNKVSFQFPLKLPPFQRFNVQDWVLHVHIHFTFNLSDIVGVVVDTELDGLAPNTSLNFPFFPLGSLSNSLDFISSSGVRTAIYCKLRLSLNCWSRNEHTKPWNCNNFQCHLWYDLFMSSINSVSLSWGKTYLSLIKWFNCRASYLCLAWQWIRQLVNLSVLECLLTLTVRHVNNACSILLLFKPLLMARSKLWPKQLNFFNFSNWHASLVLLAL